MKIKFFLLLSITFITPMIQSAKVGLCVMATGKYIRFVPQLIDSARKHFCNDHDVTFFIFTDGKLSKQRDIVPIFQKRLGWPHDTLMRFSVYYDHRDKLSTMDYVFATDADMLFVGPMGDEILSARVATQHPGYVGRRGTYETKRKSKAYIGSNEGQYYFAGGFYGGSSKEFIAMADRITKNIKIDLKRNYIAIWHDESHLNRYFIDHKPTTILDPRYCCPEPQMLEDRRLLALDKNHAEMRRCMHTSETITEDDFETKASLIELADYESAQKPDTID